MVHVYKWVIKNGCLYAYVRLYSDHKYKAIYRISDEKFKVFGETRPGDDYEINKAVVRVYGEYKRGRIKYGQPQCIAWG